MAVGDRPLVASTSLPIIDSNAVVIDLSVAIDVHPGAKCHQIESHCDLHIGLVDQNIVLPRWLRKKPVFATSMLYVALRKTGKVA